MNQNLRLYTFVNFYLSAIQQGIQSAHVVHSLFVKYPSEQKNAMLWDWATNDKTMIVLNGGANLDINDGFSSLKELLLTHNGEELPFECFKEDEYSLGGVMTSFGIVVPKEIYDAKNTSQLRYSKDGLNGINPQSTSYFFKNENDSLIEYTEGSRTHKFISMMKQCGLAK